MTSLKTRLLLILLAVGGLGWVFHGEILGEIKEWRYRKSVVEAEGALEDGDSEKVARLVGAASRLSRGSIEEIRELFALASKVRSTDSFPLGEKLFSHPEGNFLDRLSVLEFFSQGNDELYLEGLLGRLSREERKDPRIVTIRIRQLVREGNRLEALVLIDSLPKKAFEQTSLQLLKGQLLAGERGNPLAWKTCREVIGDLMAKLEGEEALAAYRILFLLPDSELKKFSEPNLRAWIKSRSDAEAADHLAAAHWQLLVNPEKEELIINEVTSFGDKAPEEVARWMLDHSQQEAILERDLVLDSEDSYPFYLARLQLHFNAGNWTAAQEQLRKPHRSMKASLLSGFRAGVAWRQKDEVAHLFNLQEALERARHSESFGEFMALFEIGKRLGDTDMVRKVCEELVRLPTRFLPRGDRLGFLDIEFGANPKFLVSLYQKLASAKPDDALINYRKVLLDFVVTGATQNPLKKLDLLLAEYPGAESLRCAKALMLAETSPRDALAWLEGGSGSELVLEGAFERAAYAALLRRNGNVERALRMEKKVDWDSLPVYLRAFFEKSRA